MTRIVTLPPIHPEDRGMRIALDNDEEVVVRQRIHEPTGKVIAQVVILPPSGRVLD